MLEPVVVRQLTEGHPVSWCPSGEVVRGRADDVAEIVNVLLENAVRHGLGAPVRIEARRRGGVVEVAVSDAGPGVPHYLRDRIFGWGKSRPDSPGRGIGLNSARELSIKNGGNLKLADSEVTGATFVLSLPPGSSPSGSRNCTVTPVDSFVPDSFRTEGIDRQGYTFRMLRALRRRDSAPQHVYSAKG